MWLQYCYIALIYLYSYRYIALYLYMRMHLLQSKQNSIAPPGRWVPDGAGRARSFSRAYLCKDTEDGKEVSKSRDILIEISKKVSDSAVIVIETYLSECILSCVGTFIWAGYGTDAGLLLGSLVPAVLPSISLDFLSTII